MENCLFTGKNLAQDSKLEHTIPASICGRIKSYTVTCGEFNNQSGSNIDGVLKESYAFFIQVLAPALSSEHKPGLLPITFGSNQSDFVMKNGVFDTKRKITVSRDPTGKPTSVSGPEPALLYERWKQIYPNSEPKPFEWIPARESLQVRKKLPLLSTSIELALLKACISSFDALIQKSGGVMFTRMDELNRVRVAIKNYILGTFSTVELQPFFLGLQYDRLSQLLTVRNRLKFPQTPFEHILVASADPGSQFVDLAIVMFSFDPFVFRVSTNWRREGFTAVAVNGVLNGTHPSEVMFFADSQSLGRPGPLTSLRMSNNPFEENRSLGENISLRRSNALSAASILVENTCDDHVIHGFTHLWRTNEKLSANNMVKTRLRRIYQIRPLKNSIEISQNSRILHRNL